MICSKNTPVFGGVYKMSAVNRDGQWIPRIKISENDEKTTDPGYKNLYRILDKEEGKAIADVIALQEEILDPDQDLTIYHPMKKWKYKTIPGEPMNSGRCWWKFSGMASWSMTARRWKASGHIPSGKWIHSGRKSNALSIPRSIMWISRKNCWI